MLLMGGIILSILPMLEEDGLQGLILVVTMLLEGMVLLVILLYSEHDYL